MALSTIVPDAVEEDTIGNRTMNRSPQNSGECEMIRVGGKRPLQDQDTFRTKRQKFDQEVLTLQADSLDEKMISCKVTSGVINEYGEFMLKSLSSFVELLNPSGGKANLLSPEVSLTALSMLAIAVCIYPQTQLSRCIFGKIHRWIPWICEQVLLFSEHSSFTHSIYFRHLTSNYMLQASQGTALSIDFFIFLEAVHSILLVECKPIHLNFAFED